MPEREDPPEAAAGPETRNATVGPPPTADLPIYTFTNSLTLVLFFLFVA